LAIHLSSTPISIPDILSVYLFQIAQHHDSLS
jgi:hypothetical protein